MIKLDKYTVFKTDELQQMMGRFLPKGDVDCAPVAQEMLEAIADTQLRDCVVIRLKDVFAESALRSYAASVLTAVDVLRMQPYTNIAQLEWLVELADYFNGAAEQASHMQKKVPTP